MHGCSLYKCSFAWLVDIKMYSVDQAGSERTEAGESALPAEESPSAGTGRAQTLRNLQENIIDFIMGSGGETSLYLP